MFSLADLGVAALAVGFCGVAPPLGCFVGVVDVTSGIWS